MQAEIIMYLGIAVMSALWGYTMFSNDPEIAKHRNTTQKFVYTAVWLFFMWGWISTLTE